eukprot:Nk52_evm1s194 gene=Nk52_evmTU1s194
MVEAKPILDNPEQLTIAGLKAALSEHEVDFKKTGVKKQYYVDLYSEYVTPKKKGKGTVRQRSKSPARQRAKSPAAQRKTSPDSQKRKSPASQRRKSPASKRRKSPASQRKGSPGRDNAVSSSPMDANASKKTAKKLGITQMEPSTPKRQASSFADVNPFQTGSAASRHRPGEEPSSFSTPRSRPVAVEGDSPPRRVTPHRIKPALRPQGSTASAFAGGVASPLVFKRGDPISFGEPSKPSAVTDIRPKSSVKFYISAFIVGVFLAVLVGYWHGASVVYCDTNEDPNALVSQDQSSCVQCPPHAHCSDGLLKCDEEYIESKGSCIPDSELNQAAVEMATEMYILLSNVAGMYKCGMEKTDKLSENQLKEILKPMALHPVQKFDICFKKALEIVNENREWKIRPKKSSFLNGTMYYRSEEPNMPMLCRLQEYIVSVVAENVAYIVSFVFVMIVWIFYSFRKMTRRKNLEEAIELQERIMEEIQNHANFHERNTRTSLPYILVAHVHDDLIPLREREKKKYVWAQAKKLMEKETRVRTICKQHAGEDMEAWEWIGKPSPKKSEPVQHVGGFLRFGSQGSEDKLPDEINEKPKAELNQNQSVPSSLYPSLS